MKTMNKIFLVCDVLSHVWNDNGTEEDSRGVAGREKFFGE